MYKYFLFLIIIDPNQFINSLQYYSSFVQIDYTRLLKTPKKNLFTYNGRQAEEKEQNEILKNWIAFYFSRR